MKHGIAQRDRDIHSLFQVMKQFDRADAPRFMPLRWVREIRDPFPVHVRRLALAAAVSLFLTALTAALVASSRRVVVDALEQPKNLIVVRKYVPPPPKVERRHVSRKKSSRRVPLSSHPAPEAIREPEPLAPAFQRLHSGTFNTESYAPISENPVHVATDEPRSTFSIDVDTASYSNVRRFLGNGARPPKDAVRIEELINYFDYEHAIPAGDDPFGVEVEVAGCPWAPEHRLARITLSARREPRTGLPGRNLVFLLDVSGSMRSPNKLPLVKQAMDLLVGGLDGRDSVAIVVYAGGTGMVLPPTSGADHATVRAALGRLAAGGSTHGAAGLRLAYRVARENFIHRGVNRVILATDGDFNVGVTSQAELLQIIETDARRGIYLTALGFGMGNIKDDRLEHLADHGNGNYAYIDSLAEARKVLVEEAGGTLVTVAKDVKIQVEFNPLEVGAYRLVGYENRLLAHRDFNDDSRDAGEMGAGHTVTALYELIPPGLPGTRAEVDALRYQRKTSLAQEAGSGELFSLKIRFKPPHGHTSALRTYRVHDDGLSLSNASDDFRFATAVAAFGMKLRDSSAIGGFDWDAIESLARGAIGPDEHGHRRGFLDLIYRARLLP